LLGSEQPIICWLAEEAAAAAVVVVVEAEEVAEWEVLAADMAVAAAIRVDMAAAATAAVTVVECPGQRHRQPGLDPRPVQETTAVDPEPALLETDRRVEWAGRALVAASPADPAECSLAAVPRPGR
jgi:hypothetical protein